MRRIHSLKRSSLIYLMALTAFGLLVSTLLHAEGNAENLLQNKITGTVTDEDTSEPLPGVSVVIKGTLQGVITDLDGRFTIDAGSEDVLVFSFIGYATQEITVGNSTTLNVLLSQSAIDMDEVVFVGFGTMKKSDLTGAITSVSEESLKTHPVTSIDQALQGRAAGVTVQQSSGSPAGGVSVLIRGASSINASSQPLYVVDGVIINNSSTGGLASMDGGQGGQNSNPLAILNPDDIASIEILKDASATAIYGTRGSNGVIAITTKLGQSGKSIMEFNASYGFQKLPKKLDVLNSLEYRRFRLLQHINNLNSGDDEYPLYINQLDIEDDQIPFTTLDPDSIDVNTDWQDEVYQVAPMQNYHLLVGGGNDKLNYKISAGFAKRDGILIGSSFERLSLSSRTESQVTDWFQLGTNILYGYTVEDMTFNDAYYGGGMVERALQQRPDMRVRDENGNFVGPDPDMEEAPDNPIAAELEKQNDNVVSRIVGNVNGKITFFKGLDFRSVFGTDISNSRTTLFNPSVDRGAIYIEDARMRESIQQNLSWSWDNFMTFNHQFGNHGVTAMAGVSWSYVKWDQFSAYRDIFPNNDARNLNLGSTANMVNGAYAGDIARMESFGRAIYNYKDYLTVTSTASVQASSKFAEGSKIGVFPSVALAWKISNHDFMQNIPAINFAKLRLGYGQAGNDNLDVYQYLARLTQVEVTLNNQVYPAFEPDGKDNPFLQWEKVISYNAGFDLHMLKSRIQLNVDFYLRKTQGMLIELNLPATIAPFGSPWANEGGMTNKGFEVNLVSHNISSQEFNWSTTATYSFNRNAVTDLEGTDIPARIRTQDPMVTLTSEGYPVAQFYGFVTDGIFRSDEEIEEHAFQNVRTRVGDIRFKDLNGDGVIDDNDKTYIGNPIPIHVFGLTNTFSFKGFDMTIFLQGMAGNQVFNWTKRSMESMKGTNNQFATVLDAYNPEDVYLETEYGTFLVAEQNLDTDLPRMTLTDFNNNTRLSDRYVEDASFLKLQTVSIGYNLPQGILDLLKMQSLRIYLTGTNLYTFTAYTGYEPEHGALFNSENNNGLLNGIDLGNYPIPRSVIAGINAKF
ncbi:MAG: TonB-dependent receptor [Bacteroidales bacterium]|nr:TonB-dependent receptor [Bacteroidales bacterium]